MAYYIAIGDRNYSTKGKQWWNRKTGKFQPYRCMNCVYPTYKGAARLFGSYTSGPYLAWQEAIDDTPADEKLTFWLLAQETIEKWDSQEKLAA